MLLGASRIASPTCAQPVVLRIGSTAPVGDAARELEAEIRGAGLGPEVVAVAVASGLIEIRYPWARAREVLMVLDRLLDFSSTAPSGRAYGGFDVRVIAKLGGPTEIRTARRHGVIVSAQP